MGATTDLIYRIFAQGPEGDGFKKTADQADLAKTKLDGLSKSSDELTKKRPKVSVDSDTGGAEGKLRQVSVAALDTGTSGLRGAAGVGMFAAQLLRLGGAAGSLPAVIALPAVMGGLAAAGGVLVGALGGVSKALHDNAAASGAAGQSSASMAVTAFSDALALRNAQASIAQARQQAVQSQASSADSLIAADERLASAQQSLTRAQQSLTQAQQDGARAQESANEAAVSSALDVKDAEFALTDAKRQQRTVDEALMSSTEDRQKAEQSVERAQQNLIQVQNRATNAAQDAVKANAAGVDGSPQVVAAKQAEASAAQQVQDAQRGLAAAHRQAADSQAASNKQISDAVRQLADVQEQQRLAAAAAASAGSAGASAFAQDMAKLEPLTREFTTRLIGMRGELHQLSVTSQNALIPGLFPLLDGVSSLMPTVNGGLAQMGTVLGSIATGFGLLMQNPAFQGQLAEVFRQGAELGQQFGSGLVTLVGSLMQAAANAGPIIGAIGTGFHDIMASGIPAFLKGLTSGATGAGQILGSVLGVVSDLLGPLGTLAGVIANALGPVFVQLRPIIGEVAKVLVTALIPIIQQLAPIIGQLAPVVGQLAVVFIQALAPIIKILAPIIGQFAVTIGTALIPIVKALSPILVLVAQAIAQLAPVLLPLIPLIANLLVGALQALLPMLIPLIPVFVQLVQIVTQVMSEAMAPLIPVILQLSDTFVKLMPQLMPLIDDVLSLIQALMPLVPIFAQLVTAVLTTVIPMIGTLIGWWAQLRQLIDGPVTAAIRGLIGVFTTVMSAVSGAIETGLGWIRGHWDTLVKDIKDLPGKLGSAGAHMWDWIKETFKAAINTVIDWWNGISFTLPKVSTPLGDLGGGTIGVPHIPRLAVGGLVTAGGMAIVGERGPEPVLLPSGARVVSNPDARTMFGAGAGPGGGSFEATVTLRLPSGQFIDQQLVEFQRNGGVSQAITTGALAALGQGAR